VVWINIYNDFKQIKNAPDIWVQKALWNLKKFWLRDTLKRWEKSDFSKADEILE
jgi:hypothetical protein